MTAGAPGKACGTCDGSGILTVPDGDGESASRQKCPEPVHDDPWGGHEFEYEPHNDLFRCVFCRKYELVVRDRDMGAIALCTGKTDDGQVKA